MLVLENSMLRMEDAMQRMFQEIQSGVFRPPDIRGPPPKAPSDHVQDAQERPPSDRSQPSPPQPIPSKQPHKASPQMGPDQYASHKGATPSPAYQVLEGVFGISLTWLRLSRV